jgi:hypothetical protein
MVEQSSDGVSGTTPEELDRLERELAVGREEVASLKERTRVLEIETGGWRPVPRPPLSIVLLVMKVIPVGLVIGYYVGTYGTLSIMGLLRR